MRKRFFSLWSALALILDGLLHPSWRNLRKLALYAFQAFLWISAIWFSIVILGGMIYLDDASKLNYADMRLRTYSILRDECKVVGLVAFLLFGIGIVRAKIARNREAEPNEVHDQPVSLKPTHR